MPLGSSGTRYMTAWRRYVIHDTLHILCPPLSCSFLQWIALIQCDLRKVLPQSCKLWCALCCEHTCLMSASL